MSSVGPWAPLQNEDNWVWMCCSVIESQRPSLEQNCPLKEEDAGSLVSLNNKGKEGNASNWENWGTSRDEDSEPEGRLCVTPFCLGEKLPLLGSGASQEVFLTALC